MGGRVLSLDTVLSGAFHFVRRWSPDLARNQSRDLLRFVLCRLYDQGRGKFIGAQLTLAQGTLGKKLGLSRRWVGILLARLQEAGWIEFSSPVLPDGMNGSTILRIGRQLKRLLVMLQKSTRGKRQVKSDEHSGFHFSPHKREKEMFSILKKEGELPKPEILAKIPLLKKWLERGKDMPVR